MKYAFYPGCVAKGGTPELFQSATLVMKKLEIEYEELEQAACTGAGVMQEKNQELGDILNARTFALAEQKGLNTILVICSTCQGVMSQANYRLKKDSKYLTKINEKIATEGLEYSGKVIVKHLMWVLIEDYGIDKLKEQFSKNLVNLRLAPFYGCYIVRPSYALGTDEMPERNRYIEKIIELAGAQPVDFPGKHACCGLPILFINQKNSLKMVANHTSNAKDNGADAMVTPCPLCHLNLDGYQDKARKDNNKGNADLPIIHLPQLLGLAMGIDAKVLGIGKHLVSTKSFVTKVK